MRRSFESMSRNRNLDMGKDPEGIYSDRNNNSKPKPFEEHMKELRAQTEELDSFLLEEGLMTWDEYNKKREKELNNNYSKLNSFINPTTKNEKDDELEKYFDDFAIALGLKDREEEKQKEIADAREAVEASFKKEKKNEQLAPEPEPEPEPESELGLVQGSEMANIETQNYNKYAEIWENEKKNANKSGVNPETGLYEMGRIVLEGEEKEKYERRKELFEKEQSGANLTLSEKMKLGGRDGPPMFVWGDYTLKPDHCYRKINQAGLDHYNETGFVDNGVVLATLGTENGRKVKGRIDTVDWYLGATAARGYGDILIEAPAKEQYFVPVIDTLSKDPDVLHMHSSGIVDPIPMSEVKVLGSANKKQQTEQAKFPKNEEKYLETEEKLQENEEYSSDNQETLSKDEKELSRNEEESEGELSHTVKFEGRKCVEKLKQIYAVIGSADLKQKEQFGILYNKLSSFGKNKPTGPNKDHQQLMQILDIRDEINALMFDLGIKPDY